MSQRNVLDALDEIRRCLGQTPADAGPAPRIEVFGAAGSLGPAIAARLAQTASVDGPLIYLVADDDRAEALVADLTFFSAAPAAHDDPLAPAAAMELPAMERSPYAEMQPDRRTIMRRMAILFRLSRGFAPRIVVASAAALFRRVVPRNPFDHLCGVLTARTHVDRDALIGRLVEAGYGRAQVVEDPGTFALRGSVVDVFPPVYRHPVRIELFGDEIESVRLYDASSQRTLRGLESVHFHPVRETIRTAGADPRGHLLAAADLAAFPSSKTRHLLDQVDEGEEFFGIEALAPAFHERMVPLFDYLPAGVRVVIEDPSDVLDEVRRTNRRLQDSAAQRRAEHRLTLDPGDFLLTETEAETALAACPTVELHSVEIESTMAAQNAEDATPRIRLNAETTSTLRAQLLASPDSVPGAFDLAGPLRARIMSWLAEGYRVRLVAPNRTHAERLGGMCQALGLAAQVKTATHDDAAPDLLAIPGDAPSLLVLVGGLAHGFVLPAERLILVAEEEILGPRSHRELPQKTTGALGDLGEIAEGDAVVHDEHGIGRYRGLKKLELRGVAQDFLQLEYDGGSVYVPVYRINLVHRYVGGTDGAVRLDKLGGKTWLEKRRRVSAETRKVAEELLMLYAQRRALPGHAFPAPDVMFQQFEETFPFDETPDQEKAIAAVLADLQAPTPMDRLICGDVGYGKTEVALRAALLAVLGGRQVAVLTPTTVLSEQHFVTFAERLRDFPVRVGSLSRFRSRAEQQQTVADLAHGRLDVVIGTHRILSRDVRFQNLGLVVIDEEQRFGVVHKERLKELRSQVDVLTLTATPIPRTLQMAMTGLREISIIATPPVDRLAIRTFVCRWDPELLGEALHKELKRGGQVFFVDNRIEELPEWAAKMQVLCPEARVAVAHGQMPEGALEKIMIDFVDGRYDILCCTTIIEAGLDIPRANTMIVNRADRFGLTQLYQLRGRIGRSRQRAFCYLVVPADKSLSADAKQRLAVLQRFTELGAGFQVSTHDLEIRGAGDLLGDRQSGALAAVGFDAYARILEEAVAELRGQPIKREHDPEIAVDLPAFLPDDYIPDTGQRLDFYRRLAQAQDEDGVRAVLEELSDRYGPLPDEATILGEVMVDRTIVRRIGALGYELGPARLVLACGADARLQPGKVLAMTQANGGRWRLAADMRLSYTFDDREKRNRLAAARLRLLEAAACVI